MKYVDLFTWHRKVRDDWEFIALPISETRSTFMTIEFSDDSSDAGALINRYEKLEYKTFQPLKNFKPSEIMKGEIIIRIFKKGRSCDLSFAGYPGSKACI